MIEVQGLTKVIKGHTVIRNVSFSVKEGEVFGLIGPNGAGKTTLLRMITGLIKPTKGIIQVKGYNMVKHFDKAVSNMGVCTETSGFYGDLSAFRNLALTAQILGIAEQKVTDVLEKVGLKQSQHMRVSKYSLGMKQRLGIANALLTDPKILILDEPTNGLDATGIIEMRNLISSLKTLGYTILLCSHLLTEIEKVCDRIAILRHGELVLPDATNHILEKNKQLIYMLETTPLIAQSDLDNLSHALLFAEDTPEGTMVHLKKDCIEDIIKSLVQLNYSIKRVEKICIGLEEVFMSYVGGELHD